MSAPLTDRAGRTKRRGNYQPYRGKRYRIVPLDHPYSEYVTHAARIDGRTVETGTPDWLRQTMHRQGADEAPQSGVA